MSEIIHKFELVYGKVASLDVIMQNFYKLQEGKTEKVTVYVIQLVGALNVAQQEYCTMLSASKVQKTLK